MATANAYSAETYNVQAGLQNYASSTDSGTKTNGNLLTGTYYLKEIVIDNKQPFMELDFLQKASNATIQYGNLSLETSVLSKTTFSPIDISGRFYVDNFIFGFNNSTFNKPFSLKSNTALNYDINSKTTGFEVGYFVTPTTAVGFVNSKNVASYTRNSTSLSTINDITSTNNGLISHTVTSLSGTQFLVVDLTYEKIKRVQTTTSTTNTEYSAKIRYYPEAKYFFEGGYTSNSGGYDFNKGKTMELGAGYSLTPRFAVLLSNSKFNGSVSAENSSNTTTTLTAGYRF
jgi:hypothetical protein